MGSIETYNPENSQNGILMALVMLYLSPAQMVSAGESIQGTYKGTKK